MIECSLQRVFSVRFQFDRMWDNFINWFNRFTTLITTTTIWNALWSDCQSLFSFVLPPIYSTNIPIHREWLNSLSMFFSFLYQNFLLYFIFLHPIAQHLWTKLTIIIITIISVLHRTNQLLCFLTSLNFFVFWRAALRSCRN